MAEADEAHKYIQKTIRDMAQFCHEYKYELEIHPTSDPLGINTPQGHEKRYKIKFHIRRPYLHGGTKFYYFIENDPLDFCIHLQHVVKDLFTQWKGLK